MREHKKLKTILILFMVVMIGVIVYFYFGFLKEKDSTIYPSSTLTSAPTGEAVFTPNEILTLTLDCPTLPYSLCVPDNIGKTTDSAIVSNYNDYTVVIAELNGALNSELEGVLNAVGVQAVSSVGVEWESKVFSSGYANNFAAEYACGRAMLSYDGIKERRYGVAYKLQVEGDANLFIYVTCRDGSSLLSAKDLLDAVLLTVHDKGAYVLDKPAQTGETITASSNTNGNSSQLPEVGFVDAENIEFMETTDGTVAGPIEPSGTAQKELFTDRDYEDMIIRFSWQNITHVPTKVAVITPTGIEYKRDSSLSQKGDYVFRIGPAEKNKTYIIHVESMDDIYGCTYYAMEYSEYMREVYPDEEDLVGRYSEPYDADEVFDENSSTGDAFFEEEEKWESSEDEWQ